MSTPLSPFWSVTHRITWHTLSTSTAASITVTPSETTSGGGGPNALLITWGASGRKNIPTDDIVDVDVTDFGDVEITLKDGETVAIGVPEGDVEMWCKAIQALLTTKTPSADNVVEVNTLAQDMHKNIQLKNNDERACTAPPKEDDNGGDDETTTTTTSSVKKRTSLFEGNINNNNNNNNAQVNSTPESVKKRASLFEGESPTKPLFPKSQTATPVSPPPAAAAVRSPPAPSPAATSSPPKPPAVAAAAGSAKAKAEMFAKLAEAPKTPEFKKTFVKQHNAATEGKYAKRTTFGAPPPPKRSLADLP